MSNSWKRIQCDCGEAAMLALIDTNKPNILILECGNCTNEININLSNKEFNRLKKIVLL